MSLTLIQHLTTNLGISTRQARGGVGILFKIAWEELEAHEFVQVSRQLKGLDDLIEAAPDPHRYPEGLGGLGSLLAGKCGRATGRERLGRALTELGLRGDMTERFINAALRFLEDKAGEAAKTFLEIALS